MADKERDEEQYEEQKDAEGDTTMKVLTAEENNIKRKAQHVRTTKGPNTKMAKLTGKGLESSSDDNEDDPSDDSCDSSDDDEESQELEATPASFLTESLLRWYSKPGGINSLFPDLIDELGVDVDRLVSGMRSEKSKKLLIEKLVKRMGTLNYY